MKTVLFIAACGVIIVGGFFALNSYIYHEKQGELPQDFKDVTFTVSGEPVTLVAGISKVPIENLNASVTTRYFGNEARGDIDGDGDEDVAFIVTQDGGGSGIFFYLVGALREDDGYRGTQAMLIGDRIAPQTTEFRNELVIVNYADRAPGEAMAEVPSIGKSLYAKYATATNDFGEVVQNFEGETSALVLRLGINTVGRTVGVAVAPEEVVEDSRCPTDVQYIQAGTVRVRAELQEKNGNKEHVFTLGEPLSLVASTITLIDVLPQPRADLQIDPLDYIFFFKVEK